jgi:two-component system OmpR family sensor kinase
MTLRVRLRRLPLRVRLVAGFSATMFVVLTAAGAFVYWRVDYALDRQINAELDEVAGVVTPLVRPSGQLAADAPRIVGDQLYQVMSRDGRVLAYSPLLGPRPLVGESTVQAALTEPVRRDIGALLPIKNRPLRAYATALPDAGEQEAAVLVVAVRRDHRDEALLELLGQLAAAGFGALLVTAFVGERLAKFALRPVERYRSQAEDIAAGASGVRLDVPDDRDDEVTRLGHTLNAMLEGLEESLERERRFVNDASHELRTPLTLLKTRVQLARRRTRSLAEHEAILAEIETDVVRLTRLADHLLQLGAQAPPAQSEGTDLAEVAEREVSRRNALARAPRDGEAPAPVQVVTSPPVDVALGAVQAAQVLGNLLENARRHGAPPVTVTVDKAGDSGRLVVVDHGPGMDAEMLATATHRFARAADSRSREGFGLGLSLVESIVVSAGGELRLCHAGRHQCSGRTREVPCEHDDSMTVTVLLPLAASQAG